MDPPLGTTLDAYGKKASCRVGFSASQVCYGLEPPFFAGPLPRETIVLDGEVIPNRPGPTMDELWGWLCKFWDPTILMWPVVFCHSTVGARNSNSPPPPPQAAQVASINLICKGPWREMDFQYPWLGSGRKVLFNSQSPEMISVQNVL